MIMKKLPNSQYTFAVCIVRDAISPFVLFNLKSLLGGFVFSYFQLCWLFSLLPFLLAALAKSAPIDFFHPVLQWPLLHLKQRLNYWISVSSSFFPLSCTHLYFFLPAHSIFSPFFITSSLVQLALSEQLYLFILQFRCVYVTDSCLCFPV